MRERKKKKEMREHTPSSPHAGGCDAVRRGRATPSHAAGTPPHTPHRGHTRPLYGEGRGGRMSGNSEREKGNEEK